MKGGNVVAAVVSGAVGVAAGFGVNMVMSDANRKEAAKIAAIRLIQTDAGGGEVFSALWGMSGLGKKYGLWGGAEEAPIYNYYLANIWVSNENAKANPEAVFETAWNYMVKQ